MGYVALQRGQTAPARASYEQALRLQPSLHDARVGLITADIAEKNLSVGANARVNEWRAQSPDDVRLKVLSARGRLVAGRTAEAERTLRDVDHVRCVATSRPTICSAGSTSLAVQVDRAIAEFARSPNAARRPPARGR